MTCIIIPLEHLLRLRVFPLKYSRNAEKIVNIITNKTQVLNKYALKTQIQLNKLRESLSKFKELLREISGNEALTKNREVLKYLYEEFRVLSIVYIEKKLVTWENHNYLSLIPLDDLINLMRIYLLIDLGDLNEALKILKSIPLHRIVPGIEKPLIAPQWVSRVYESISTKYSQLSELLETFGNLISNYIDEYNKFLSKKVERLDNVLHKLFTS